jgi:beta-lactamase regulating signal transducer with metallopeptidase domain
VLLPLVALLVLGSIGFRVGAFVRAALLSARTARTLREGSSNDRGLHVFSGAGPQTFVLGVFSPAVYASAALLRMPRDVVAPAIAHERAHARARDSLWRALCPLLGCLHVPLVARLLTQRLAAAQEMAADAAAAEELGDPLLVAESLIALAREHVAPAPGLAFMHGDLSARVRELLASGSPKRAWPGRALASIASVAVVALCVAHKPVHHALEGLLGLLS